MFGRKKVCPGCRRQKKKLAFLQEANLGIIQKTMYLSKIKKV